MEDHGGLLPVTPQRLTAVETIERSKDLAFLDVQDRKLLFRVDGLVVAISDLIYDLFVTYRTLSPSGRIKPLVRCYGSAAVDQALEAVVEICKAGVLTGPLRELPRKDPGAVQPSGIVLMVAQTCNLDCTYCYGGGGSYGSKVKRMDSVTAKAAIDLMIERAPAKESYTVTFFGGEPLLNIGLIREVVAYCKSRGQAIDKAFGYSMTSNGTLLTERILDFLRENKFALMVSLDGPEGIHDSLRPYRNGKGSFAAVTRNIRRLTEAGIPVQMRATLTRHTLSAEALRDLVRIGRELGCSRVVTSPVDTSKSEGEVDEQLRLEGDDLRKLEEIYREFTEANLDQAHLGKEVTADFDPHVRLMRSLAQGRARGLTQCGACFGMAAVASDGTLYPCHRFVGMRAYEIGSVKSGFDLGRIKSFFARADRAYASKCPSCWARQVCCGVCYFHIADGHGDFVEPDEAACESFCGSLGNAAGYLTRLRGSSIDAQRRYMESVRFL